MTDYRFLLAVVSDAASGRAPVETALALARDMGGHVDALHVRNDPTASVPLVGEGMSGAMVEEMIEAAEQQIATRAKASRAMVEDLCARLSVPLAAAPPAQGLTASWHEETGREDDVVTRRGRLADLIVVGQPQPDSDTPAPVTLQAALMDSGRPVLMVPAKPPQSLGRRIAVAWNGSAEAARALWSALPLLARANAVAILTADEDSTAPVPAAALCEALAWHGITAAIRPAAAHGTAGAALLDEATAFAADLLVMGAYTHSRLRQLILGGVTRHVLGHATLPVLMSH